MIVDTIDGDRKVAINIRDVPAELRNDFKAHCSQHELTMTEMILGFMRRTVQAAKSGRNPT